VGGLKACDEGEHALQWIVVNAFTNGEANVGEDELRADLIETLRRLPIERLSAAAAALRHLARPAPSDINGVEATNWPHAPVHHLSEHGTYFVTTGTHHKEHVFHNAERLTLLQGALLRLAVKHAWNLEAWAVFSNHYHFVAYTHSSPSRLGEFLAELHACTAREVNRLDATEGRQGWHNFWDKQLTYEKSYFARLNYTHQNAVRHGLVPVANQYPWCSPAWFERTATPAQVKTIYSFKAARVRVPDDFEPLGVR